LHFVECLPVSFLSDVWLILSAGWSCHWQGWKSY